MALITLGKSPCPLCNQPITETDELIGFPAFISNQLDPLFLFSDAAFHAGCFHRHPLSEEAEASYTETVNRAGPGHRCCVVCKREITDPDDYLTLGHLTADRKHPLHRYNHTQLHRSCVSSWSDLPHVHTLLDDFQSSGRWKGAGLAWLLDEIRRNLPQSAN